MLFNVFFPETVVGSCGMIPSGGIDATTRVSKTLPFDIFVFSVVEGS